MDNYKLMVLAPPVATDVLEQIGISFEKYEGARPLEINSDEEMFELADRMLKDADKNTIVLATYTELILNKTKMGIPLNEEEAENMLNQLSGKTHHFITKMCIGGAGQPVDVIDDTTAVTFKELSEWEVKGYTSFLDYNYPGAYSPMGKGAFFIRSISGDYNVIKGMPVNMLIGLLEKKYGITPVEGKNIWWKGSNK